MLKAYGRTIVGMSPIWLMGEAITGKKVGSQFRKGTSELVSAAEELRGILSDSTKDVLVVVDDKLRTGKTETTKTADILRSAGEDAIVVVTSSILNSRSQFEANAPQLKHTVLKHSKDCVIIMDKAIKHPIVITGVTKFAKSKGIPRPEAILTIAALGVGKLVKILDEAETEARGELERFEADMKQKATLAEREDGDLVHVDAGEFEKTVPREDSRVADQIGHAAAPPPGYDAAGASTSTAPAGAPADPAMPGALPASKKDKTKKEKDGCIAM